MQENTRLKHKKTGKIVQHGGCLYVGLPISVCKDLRLGKGDTIDLFANDEVIMLRRHKQAEFEVRSVEQDRRERLGL